MHRSDLQAEAGKICVSIGQKNVAEALAAAKEAETVADVIEIRLDIMDMPEPEPFAAALSRPLLFTCRPEWEGGMYSGEEPERIELLIRAIRGGAAYVDLELLAPEESYVRLAPVLQEAHTRLVVSNHDFFATPPREELLKILQGMKDRGADIGKIVTTANDFQDVLRVLQLQQDAREFDMQLIAFCMGRAGVVSRLATLELGGFMTYCAPTVEEATAPGQIPAQTLREVIHALALD